MPPATDETIQFIPSSDQTLLVRFGGEIDEATHRRIVRTLRLLEADAPPGIRNLHPAYCSLLVKFDPLQFTHAEMEATLRRYVAHSGDLPAPEPREVEIPVCYGGELGPDLEEVARLHGMVPEQVVEIHSSTTYLAYFLGFVPGFAFLGGLPESIATPRLPTPRKAVPAGSVGIAGRQAGVYPFSTPGGWRLLGRTPVRMFRPHREPWTLISIGDHVRFVPISRALYDAIEGSWR